MRMYRINDKWMKLQDEPDYLISKNHAYEIEDVEEGNKIRRFIKIKNTRYEIILKKEEKPFTYQELQDEDYDILGDKI